MKHLYTVNTAVFLAVAAMHALRLAYQAPASVGSYDIALWLSAVAVAGTAILAWLNWSAVGKHTQADVIRFVLALIVIDAFILFYSWVSGFSYWGISHDTFLWFILMDLVLFAIVHGSMRMRRS